MRVSFRTKIFLSLVLTVAAILGGALFLVERAYASKVEELIRSRREQGEANFREHTRQLLDALRLEGGHLSRSPRIRSSLEEERLYPEAGKYALYEIEYRTFTIDFLAITNDEGRTVARFLARAGQAGALEARPAAPGPEVRLVRRLIDGDDPDSLFTLLVDEGRLFRVMAFGLFDGDVFRGVIVLGKEITDAMAARIHQLQAEHDHAAYAVGDRLVATSLRADLGPLAPGIRDLAVGGRPYRVVVSRPPEQDSPEPVQTALLISLQELLEFRDRTRRTVLLLAAGAVALSLLLSIGISRGVTAPVRDLVAGTKVVASGDYSHRIRVRSRDELGDLAEAFNTMANDLAAKEKIRGVLNKVVAREVAEELLQGDLGLGGREVRATLLFADLRGFTEMTQGMAPQAIVSMLNEFMTAMSAEIFACKGIVDKYVGDEIIGVFGAPKSYGHDARAAVEAAERMRGRLESLNADRARRGERPLAMGIGIHSGDVVAGCMGSDQLMSYTCIGAAMNLAARLCSAARPGQILVSEEALREAGDGVEARPLEPVSVKGFRDPVAVYEVSSVEIGGTARRRKVHG